MSQKNQKSSEADALFKLIMGRYGSRLSQAELEEVQKGIETIVDNAETLRAVKLPNSVEPFSIFRPQRKGG